MEKNNAFEVNATAIAMVSGADSSEEDTRTVEKVIRIWHTCPDHSSRFLRLRVKFELDKSTVYTPNKNCYTGEEVSRELVHEA